MLLLIQNENVNPKISPSCYVFLYMLKRLGQNIFGNNCNFQRVIFCSCGGILNGRAHAASRAFSSNNQSTRVELSMISLERKWFGGASNIFWFLVCEFRCRKTLSRQTVVSVRQPLNYLRFDDMSSKRIALWRHIVKMQIVQRSCHNNLLALKL